jgi:hypothetical protein
MPPEARRLLEEQLGRMRGLHYNYYDQFFRFLNIHLVTLILVVVAALAFDERAVLLVPFYAVFIGFHSSYLFSYVTLARTYATAIEQRLNHDLGGEYLIAHQLEATYVFPISRPRFVAWSPSNRTSFLSAETVMFTGGLGLIVVITGIWGLRISWDIGSGWAVVFTALLVLWSVGCMGFVWWYHFRSDYEARLRRVLEDRYGISYVNGDGSAL